MFKKDYLLRIIEEIIRIIGRILHLIKEGDFDKAEKMLKEAYELIEVNEDWKNISITALIQLMEKKEFSYSKMEIIADLIKVEGDIVKAQGKEGYHDLYIKALAIYEYLDQNDVTYSFERADKIIKLKNIVE